jgi:hypothetical protein
LRDELREERKRERNEKSTISRGYRIKQREKEMGEGGEGITVIVFFPDKQKDNATILTSSS